MTQISTSPRQQTVLRLEARRPAAINMIFVDQDIALIDLTGCTLTLVIAEPKHMGSTVMLTQLATEVDPLLGTMRFDVQGDDLNLNPDVDYNFAMTLVTPEGFGTSVVKGTIDIQENPDPVVPTDYTAVAPPMGLTVKMLENNRITVKAFHYPDASLLGYVSESELDALVAALAADLASEFRETFDPILDTEYVSEVDLDAGVAAFIGNPASATRIALDPDIAAEYIASNEVRNLVVLTQAAYDALDPKIATTLYVIVG